jgi:hypothetical protein
MEHYWFSLMPSVSSGSDADSGEREAERPTPPPRQRGAATIHHAPLPTPPPEDMEPQSVSFVQDDNAPSSDPASLASSTKKSLQITSGSKTYRITPESGSPPRPSAHRLFSSDITGKVLKYSCTPFCHLRANSDSLIVL